MTEEGYSPRYSAFWPVTIVLATFAFTYIYQIVELVSHRSAVNKQYTQAAQDVPKAQAAHDRLLALITDLVNAAPKDPNAVQIVRLAIQSGIVTAHPRTTGGADTNAAPAAPSSSESGVTPPSPGDTNLAPANP